MTTPQELREAYLTTVINVEIEPGRWVLIDEAVRSFPTPLHVVTPWNPFSVVLSKEANSERMTGLMSDLAMTSAAWFNATGSSSRTSSIAHSRCGIPTWPRSGGHSI